MAMSISEFVRLYDRGAITRHELLIRLCQAAAEQPPHQLAPALSAEELAEVREWSTAPPESPDKCRVIHAGGFIGDAEYWERHFREESRRLYDGLWRWHRYFAEAQANAVTDPAG
jgi:hypothetical protein